MICYLKIVMNGLQINWYISELPDRYDTSTCHSRNRVIFKIPFWYRIYIDSGSNKNYLSIKGVHALT